MTNHDVSLPLGNEEYSRTEDAKIRTPVRLWHLFRSRPSNLPHKSPCCESETQQPGIILSSKLLKGRLFLGFVALLYGTHDVAARIIYGVPVPPTPAAFSATRGWISFFGFLLPLALHSIHSKKTGSPRAEQHTQNAILPLLMSGLELAIWNGGNIALSFYGLLSTEAARSSSLSQLTVLFTPLITLVFHGKASVNTVTWCACCIALIGLLFVAMGGSDDSLTPTLSKGDLCMLGAAFSMSMYIVRISALAPKYPSLVPQGTKTAISALFCSAWWPINTATNFPGGLSLSSFSSLPSWMTSGAVVWIALTCSAIGCGTAADVLQQKGQELISSTESSILMSMEPAFAPAFGVLLLGETPSKCEFIGGALMVVAAVVVALGDNDSANAVETIPFPSVAEAEGGSDAETDGGKNAEMDVEREARQERTRWLGDDDGWLKREWNHKRHPARVEIGNDTISRDT